MRCGPYETEWDARMRHQDEDYHTYGAPAPWWDIAEEEWERRERAERHHDFIYRVPPRESDDWWELAA